MSVYRTTGPLVTFTGPLGQLDPTLLFWSRVALNPQLGSVRDVALPLYLMNRLNKTESAVFKLWMMCFLYYFSFEDLPLSPAYQILSVQNE